MKIVLFGYGKMGKIVETTAVGRGHTIVKKIDGEAPGIRLSEADVAIDFSSPAAAFKNISLCLEQQVPVISGTTGWLKDYDRAVGLCNEKNGAFIYASNFSLGVNLFFQLNTYLAKLMNGFPEYDVDIEEIHHTEKLDAPSGTAITLAEAVIANSTKTGWKLGEAAEHELPVTAKRIAGVPGTHSINYHGSADTLTITHTAHNRSGFALGAVIAAEWIMGKKGVYTMKDVLNSGEIM